jgi:ArsR family transcriptional regulator
VFRALGDPHRLRALHFLMTAEPSRCASGEGVCACDLVAHLGLSQPTVSHHMRVLVACGLVDARKRGRWTHYTVCPAGLEAARTALNGLLGAAGPDGPPAAGRPDTRPKRC